MSSNRRASFPVNALRRSPRRRTKTPSVNELSKKCKLSPRGKRKLEFQHDKPLKGRTYYLDLPGYRKLSSLQTRIKELGGVVEEFLSKDIGYVVTNRKDADTGCSPRSNSTPSPILSVPSPFPGNTKSSSAKGSAVPSPLSADSAGAEQPGPHPPKHNIRGKALAAQAALTCKHGTSNVIANARNWGVEIVSLEKMLETLEQFRSIVKKPSSSKPLVTGRVPKQGVKPKVRKLRAPFIKVEDHSRCYKPLVHELKEWPKIYLDSPLGSCPFDPPKVDLENDHEGRDRTKRKPVQEDKHKKKGFCECCCVHYEDLDLHLQSDRHQSFARDPSNYRSLDELIKKGPSLQDFLEKMLLQHEQKQKEQQEKPRNELTNSEKSVAEGENKTPTKHNTQDISSNCQTPVRHIPGKDTECYTPINPSPGRKSSCHTPSNHSSPEKRSGDEDTPTRVLRSGSAKTDTTMGERRSLHSSPGTSNTLKEKKNEELATTKQKVVKKKELNLEKSNNKSPEKRARHAKTPSTSSSPVAVRSNRDNAASGLVKEPDSQVPAKKGLEKKSPNRETQRDAVEARLKTQRRQSDSSGESSSKENHDPETQVDHLAVETVGDEEQVGRSTLRLKPIRADHQLLDKGKVEHENHVEAKTDAKGEFTQDHEMASPRKSSLRSATKLIPANELTNTNLPATDVEMPNAEALKRSPEKPSVSSAGKMSPARKLRNLMSPTKMGETNSLDVETGSPRRRSLRFAAKVSPARKSSESSKTSEAHQSPIKEDCGQDREKSSTKSFISFAKMSPAKELENPESPTREAQRSAEVVEKRSHRKSSLRSAAKLSPVEELKSPKSPKIVEEASAVEEILERTTRSRTQLLTKTINQSSDDSTTKNASKISLNDGTVEYTYTSTQLADCSNLGENTEVAEGSADKEKPEIYTDQRQANPRIQVDVRKRDTLSSRGDCKTVADKSESDSQSSRCRPRGSEVVNDVKVQLYDCRRMCVGRNRPVLERQSDESETESIQLSSEENYSPRKGVFTNGTSSYEEAEEISSTPTLNPCPSSPSSEKSGYSDERGGYSLRKRAAQQQEEEPIVSRRTRSNYKIPSEESQKASTGARERRKTVPSPYTSVKTKSPKQRCHSVRSLGNSTPERKKLKNSTAVKSPPFESPRRKVPRKEPSSESESSAHSDSPRSGPIREARGTLTRFAVRSLSTANRDSENTEALSVLSETTTSLGNLSTVAVCGTPWHSNLASHCPKRGETLLSGTDLSKQVGSQSADYLHKDRTMEPEFSHLFDSGDEHEDFYGFHVPQFDRSFSSEGDLSYKINSLVESMSQVDTSQDTIDDVENVTIQKDETETEINENEQENDAKAIDEREINGQEKICGKIVAKNEKVYKRKVTRKRSASPVIADVKRVESYSQGGGQRVGSLSINDSASLVDDVDEDDDVFSLVSDSSEGEEEDEVSSPLSITSWRKKRKSEDLQPEVDRPAKRRRSNGRWSESSNMSSMSETPVKSKPDRGIQEGKENGNKKTTGFGSKLDEMLEKENKNRVPSLSSVSEFYDSDEPVFQTLEERVKLRRLRKISRKAGENFLSSEQNQDIDMARKSQAKTKAFTETQVTTQKKALRLQTASSRKDSSSKRKAVTPLRSSSRLNRANSSPGVSESPLTASSGKPRRSTWIDGVREFTSSRLELPSSSRKRFRCSTPASAGLTKHSLRFRGRDKVESRNAKQKDPFAFDE